MTLLCAPCGAWIVVPRDVDVGWWDKAHDSCARRT